MDTGSANMAVVTADCCSDTNADLYSCSSSSTCVSQSTDVSVTYVTGSWSGTLVKDTVSASGLGQISSMPFVEITEESNFISSSYDGIVGLAYQTIASPTSDPPTPYFDVVRDHDSLANVFSMLMCGALQSLAGYSGSLEDEETIYAGELLLGGTAGPDGTAYHSGDLVYTPLVQKKWYNVVVTDIGVSGESLDLDCEDINSPRSIVDSGTSNMAFPSTVYTAIVAQLKTDVAKVMSVDDSFFSDETACCTSECDPTNANSSIYSLPSLYVTLASDDNKKQRITIEIPPQYIWRPILYTSMSGIVGCRVFGISEGSSTLLGDVFMDGLLTVHDRDSDRVGFGVAASCPNGVTSAKTITVSTVDDSYCDCLSSSDRKESLVSSFIPLFGGKTCFFWVWWMYIVIVCIVLILLCIGVLVWLHFKRRKMLRELQQMRGGGGGSGGQVLRPQQQRQLSNDVPGLQRNLLTPTVEMTGNEPVAPYQVMPSGEQYYSQTNSLNGYLPPAAAAAAPLATTGRIRSVRFEPNQEPSRADEKV